MQNLYPYHDEHYDEVYREDSDGLIWRDDVKEWLASQVAMQTGLIKTQMEASYRQTFGEDAPDIGWDYFKPGHLDDIIADCIDWGRFES